MTGVSRQINENIAFFRKVYGDCADVKMQRMELQGLMGKCTCFVAYIEVSLNNTMVRDTALGQMFKQLGSWADQSVTERNRMLDNNAMGIADIGYYAFLEDAAEAMLTGDAILLVEGYEKALKIADKGYPGMGVEEAESEKVVRGSNEGFSDSVKTNTALIRKRLRSTQLKNKEIKTGTRTRSLINIMYMDGIVRPDIVGKIEKKLEGFTIDGVLDSGVIEQLMEKKWYSPFPQYQTTQRPDRAVMSLLEGRVVILCDNSPVALICPADFNSFLRTADDYYNRMETVTFARMLRYIAVFFSMTLPGLYLAVTNYHTQILPTTLLLSFQEARIGVPFPAALEVLLMEISFELLREAGIRLPGAMGNTIGIVGGLIIGQAAVDANIVSPMVVILVAFTALCSFAIPNEEFAFSFRILKFFFILMAAWMGFYGFLIGLIVVLIHLTRLESFGMAYLMPFVGAELNHYRDLRDAMVRFPIRKLKWRTFNAKRDQRRKLRFSGEEEEKSEPNRRQ